LLGQLPERLREIRGNGLQQVRDLGDGPDLQQSRDSKPSQRTTGRGAFDVRNPAVESRGTKRIEIPE